MFPKVCSSRWGSPKGLLGQGELWEFYGAVAATAPLFQKWAIPVGQPTGFVGAVLTLFAVLRHCGSNARGSNTVNFGGFAVPRSDDATDSKEFRDRVCVCVCPPKTRLANTVDSNEFHSPHLHDKLRVPWHSETEHWMTQRIPASSAGHFCKSGSWNSLEFGVSGLQQVAELSVIRAVCHQTSVHQVACLPGKLACRHGPGNSLESVASSNPG